MGMSACQTKTLLQGFLVALDLRDFDVEHENAATAGRQLIEAGFVDVRAMVKGSTTDRPGRELGSRRHEVIGKAGDAIRTRDFHVGNVTLYH